MCKRLGQLPDRRWTDVDSYPGGYQMLLEPYLLGRRVVTLLDYGAAVSAVTEELVCGCITYASARGLVAGQEGYPIERLERYPAEEEVIGIAKKHPIKIIGAAVMKVTLGNLPKSRTVPIRFKIFANGTSSWHGFILGARTLDVESRGGLGLQVEHDRYRFGAVGAILPRIEQGRLPRQDEVYRFWSFPVHMPRVAAAASVFDEEEEGPGLGEMTGEALRYTVKSRCFWSPATARGSV